MLCAEGCILKLYRSLIDECDYFFVQVEDPYLGIILNIKGILSNFCEKKCVMKGLLGDLYPMHLSRPWSGCDTKIVEPSCV